MTAAAAVAATAAAAGDTRWHGVGCGPCDDVKKAGGNGASLIFV